MRCRTCHQECDLSEFRLRKGASGRHYRSRRCAACVTRRRRLHRDELADWLERYKSKRACARCGFDDPRALDFHHTDRAAKKRNVSDLVVRGAPLAAIEAEIALCELVCANCHRLAHRKRRRRRPLRLPVPAPPPKRRTPKLCLHKTHGHAYVTDPATGRAVIFGPWGSEAAELGYRLWAGAYRGGSLPSTAALPRKLRSLERHCLAFVEHFARALLREAGQVGDAAKDLAAVLATLDTLRLRAQRMVSRGQEGSETLPPQADQPSVYDRPGDPP